MSLLTKAKKAVKKLRKKSRAAAQKANTERRQVEQKQQKKGAASSSYDRVREKANAQPKVYNKGTSGGGTSGGRSGGNRGSSGWGAVTKAGPTRRPQKSSSSSSSGGWNSYAKSTFKSTTKAGTVPRTSSGAIDWGKINSKNWTGTASKNDPARKAANQAKNTNALGTTKKTDTLKYGPDKILTSQKHSPQEHHVQALSKGAIRPETQKTKYHPQAHVMENTMMNQAMSEAMARNKAREDAKKSKDLTNRLREQGYDIPKDKVAVSDNYDPKGPEASNVYLVDKKTQTKKALEKAYVKETRDTASKRQARAQEKLDKKNSGTLKSEQLTNEEYLKLQNASRIGGKRGNAALGKELSEKVGSRTAWSADRGTAARASTGVMQGLAYADVLNGGVGTYNKDAKGALKEAKESTAFNVGYGAGQMAGSILGGTSSAAKALTTAGLRAGAREAAQIGAKSAGRKFARNRATEMALETPMNVMDAVKMSRDENGKIDRKQLATYLALNTGMTGAAGGLMEGASQAFTRRNANRLISLQTKASKGNLSKQEGQELKGLYDKLNRAREDVGSSASNAADEGIRTARGIVDDTRLQRRHAKASQRASAAAELARRDRTAANNDAVDRLVEQYARKEQKAKNAETNRRIGQYASDVAERERQTVNDRELLRGNEDVARDGSFIDSRRPTYSDRRPKNIKENPEQSKASKDAVHESLNSQTRDPQKFSAAETKEINDGVDRVSNMIHNGDVDGAREESRRIAAKYGRVDTDELMEQPERVQVYNEIRRRLHGMSLTMSGDTRTIREFLEAFGTTKEELGRKLKIRKGRGTFHTYGIDTVWDELASDYPGYITRDVNETEKWQTLIDIAKSKTDDIRYDRWELPDEAIEAAYDSIADDIFKAAERNADNFIDDNAETVVEQAARSTEDAEAGAKAMQGANVEDAQERMRQAKTAKANKDLDAYVKSLEEDRRPVSDAVDEEPTPKAETKTEEAPEANPTETKAEATEETTAETKEISDKVSEIGEYSNTDKRFKAASHNILENAPEQAEKVSKLADEYQANSKAIAANKEKAKNSKTPKHIKQYNKAIEKLEAKQEGLAKQISDLEDTYVSRYDDGKEVLGDIDPTDGKSAVKKKTIKFWNKIQTIRRLTENSLTEFERAAKQSGDSELLNAVNNVIYARNKAGAWIETARSSFTSRTAEGKSLNQIFKDAGAFKSRDVRADFNQYALLRHHIDRAEKGKPVFMQDGKTLSIPDAQKAMAALESKYDAIHGIGKGKAKLEAFSDELTAYSNDLLKYRLDAGLISKETYEQTINDYPHYVPTYRIMDNAEGFVYEEAQGASLDAVIKGAKGGDSPIEDIYSQLYKITNDVITNAEQNEMVKLYAKDMGFDVKRLSKEASFEDLEKTRIKAGKNGTISYFVDGQRTTFVANEQAVKGLREWNGNDFAVFANACAKIGKASGMRIFKGLITDWNVAFGLRNGARDYQQALVNSKNTRWFFRSHPAAINAIAHKGNAYRKLYEVNGGKYYVPSGDPRMVKDPTKTSAFEKVVAPVEAFNGAIEIFPRMSEFIGTINKEADEILSKQKRSLKDLRIEAEEYIEKHPPKDEADIPGAIEDRYAELVCDVVGKETVDRAMRNAADITLNFSRSGAVVKALNSGVVPYLNPSVQGLSKTIRLFTEGKADKALLSIGAKLSVLTVAPAMANEYFMRNNRDYQDLNTRDKDTQFFIPLGDGKFIKIPKPRENAVMAEPFTYGLRYFFDKAQVGSISPGEYSSKENWKQMFVTARDNIGPVNPFTSNYFSPLINTARNKTWYGGNIESVSDQKLPVRDRKDETTSALAIMLGNSEALNKFADTNFAKNNAVGKLMASNLSPKKIDNLMDSYLGMIYDMGIKPTAANRNFGNTKDNLANYFTTQFILDGVYSNKLADGYYSKLDKLNKGAEDGKYTYKAKIYMQDYGYDAMNYSSARTTIFSDDKDFAKMTAKEKQEYARALKKYQNEVYRDGMNGAKGTFGTFEDNFKRDSFRIMARLLKGTSFEKKTGKMAEEKVLEDFTYTNDEGNNMFRDAFDAYRESDDYKAEGREKGVKKFFNDTIRLRGLLGEAGASKSFPTWTAASLVAAERNKKSGDESHTAFAKAFGSSDDSIQEAKNYLDYDYTLKNYAHTHKTLERMAMREDKYLRDMDDNKKSVALANKKYSDGSFYIEGRYVDTKCNYARCIASDGVSSKEYNKWMDDNGLRSYTKESQDGLKRFETRNGSVYYKSSEEDVINAIEKDYGDRSDEFKAAMFRMFYEYGDNPYGEVGDYSQDNDRGLHHEQSGYGYGGRRRRRRGHRRRGWHRRGGYGGGGGGGGGTGKDWNTFVGEIFTEESPSGSKSKADKQKIHDFTHKSELNEAYRRRAQKKQMAYKKS